MKKKGIIIGGCTVVIICIVVILCIYLTKNNKPNVIDESYRENVAKNDIVNNQPQSFGDATIKIENEELQYEELVVTNFEAQMVDKNTCEIRATVKNTTDKLVELKNVKLVLTNDDGTVSKIGAQIDSIKPNGEVTMYTPIKRNNAKGIKSITIESNEQ